MKFVFTWRSLVALGALLFVLGEAHELVHITVGRLLCGCWGPRDFNVWELCDSCAASRPLTLAATFAGPLFTFAVGWLGYWLLGRQRPRRQRSLGLALVFASMPFARLLSSLAGGNDEVFGLRQLLPMHIAWPLGTGLVFLATFLPILRAYFALRTSRQLGVFAAFLVLPMFVYPVVILGGLNPLLASGFLSEPGILGSPLLITAWMTVTCLLLGLTYRGLFTMMQPIGRLSRRRIYHSRLSRSSVVG